ARSRARPASARRRTRRAAGNLPAGSPAGPSAGSPRTWAPTASALMSRRVDRSVQTAARAKPARPEVGVASAASGRLRLVPQPLELLLAPLHPPLVERHSPPPDDVGQARLRRLGAVREECREDLEVVLVTSPAALEQHQRLFARQSRREEQPQERLVTELDPRARAQHPLDQRLAARFGQPVDAARAAAVGRILTVDETLGLEPAQLWVDLAVARGPEEPSRLLDCLLHVVPRHRRICEEAEDDGRYRAALLAHISRRYIFAMHLSSKKEAAAPRGRTSHLCAGEDLNLHGVLTPQGPQPCASTNSATSAREQIVAAVSLAPVRELCDEAVSAALAAGASYADARVVVSRSQNVA